MIHVPTVIGLIVCAQVIVEKGSENLSLINCFTIRKIGEFPSLPQRFAVVAFMTDGLGSVPMQLTIKELESLEEIHHHELTVEFPDRLREVRFLFRLTEVIFPAPGDYDVCLLAKDDLLAQHRIQVR